MEVELAVLYPFKTNGVADKMLSEAFYIEMKHQQCEPSAGASGLKFYILQA